LRIGLEVSPVAVNATGIPNYIRRLVEGFASLDDGNEYFLYTNRPLPEDFRLPERFRKVLVRKPYHRFQLWFQLELPGRMRKDGIGLFHGTFSRLPARMPVPGVITIHDLSGYNMPHVHKRWTRATNRLYPLYLRKAAAVITVSEFTASQVREAFPWAEDKIRVVHEAAPPDYAPVTDETVLERVRKKYGLPDRFFLFLGSLEPRKNLERLLEAYISVSRSIPHSLVISGGEGWKNTGLLDAVRRHGDRVILTGFVEPDDLPGLLSLAECLVYPSLYEGFGLPILEAMACGTPVITSSVSSMPEVAGDAALLANPYSVEEIAGALSEMALDGGLRENLRKKGFLRNAEFSWKKSAEKTLSVYMEVLSGGGAL